MTKLINILGSTGSIGTSTLKVVQSQPDDFKINLLLAGNNLNLLKEQIMAFNPTFATIQNPSRVPALVDFLNDSSTETGYLSYEDALQLDCDIAMSAIVGTAGLLPTLHAIQHADRVALANKETLVAGGDIIASESEKYATEIIPVDSEHNAIHQCLRAGDHGEATSLVLTASGGPFFGMTSDVLQTVTVAQALDHPTWQMGNKVTIDSATLMNKGLEVIEAHFLFQMPYDRIQVKIHPQSVVHSMVEFQDGSIVAQLGIADMQLPIQYALYYPRRPESQAFRFPLEGSFSLTFHDPDMHAFRCLQLAYQCGRAGAAQRIILNAANEVAVDAFLNGGMSFTNIPVFIEHMLNKINAPHPESVEAVVELDFEVKKQAELEVKGGHF